jgi:hypothetical protein
MPASELPRPQCSVDRLRIASFIASRIARKVAIRRRRLEGLRHVPGHRSAVGNGKTTGVDVYRT